MARTDADSVKGVLRLGTQGGDYDDRNAPSLTPYISAATVVVDRVDTCATAKEVTLTSTELTLIETWLAAHFYKMSDQPYAEKKIQRAAAVYQGRTGMNFEGTKYGQTAMSLDPSGCLASLGKRNLVGMNWLGKPPSEQTDYTDRD